jgi:hypothetical protein
LKPCADSVPVRYQAIRKTGDALPMFRVDDSVAWFADYVDLPNGIDGSSGIVMNLQLLRGVP